MLGTIDDTADETVRAMAYADARYFPNAVANEKSHGWLTNLQNEISWRQHRVRVFGRQHDAPRLSAWHGDPECHYGYSGVQLEPAPWTTTLLAARASVSSLANVEFNSVLVNLYRDGADSMGWHSDDEPELGPNPVIASLSLGATRRFRLRRKQHKSQSIGIDLEHGSVLLLAGKTQAYWQHALPKTRRLVGPRINLTFRTILI